MEGKFVVLSVLMMSLIMSQIQVEGKVCCPSQFQRSLYEICYWNPVTFRQMSTCSAVGGCKLIYTGICPSNLPYNNLEKSGDDVNKYCNLGCASSVCSAMTTLKNFDASEIVNGAIEKCISACSTLCTKGFVKPATETA
ncbi:hypothetical protein CARUB_v10005983mg [Capsella rubella]|uniref:Acidic protein n=1 Tax=Capsella rubella TaxID=81985 RepID=R0H2A1_9BRAS|nr:probable thionin-2.3 [Capsella rubella]EOA17618.1 hypothetical protein CARUB_v10005983mg [Capsella rubella]